MRKTLKEYSLTHFELWCHKAMDYFEEINDEVGTQKIKDTIQIIDIFRDEDGKLFFLEEEKNE